MQRRSVKKLLINLVFLFIASAVFAQDTTFTTVDPESGLTTYTVERTDATTEQGYLLNGKKEGLVRTFFANGVLQTATEYHQNIPDGWYIECEKNGVVLKEEHYKDGMLNGEARTYTTKQGVRIVHSVYHYQDGKYHGTCTDYSDMGKMSAQATYNNGIKDGPSRWYYTNGLLAMEQHYRDGQLNGIQTAWGPNGNVSQSGSFSQNMKEGEWKEYYPNGVLKSVGSYKADQKSGTWMYYDEEGNLSSSETY